ncbi:hypothetical protein [Microvirga rosea]|nr:hypothetical protein [Microvirga rosea]
MTGEPVTAGLMTAERITAWGGGLRAEWPGGEAIEGGASGSPARG